jgi:ADP-ribose pyrophosphatase YjhB (NUDIX family)
MMPYRGRAQCVVTRGGKLLLVKHCHGGVFWYCTPGGGIEPGETPEQAALRGLWEECRVEGTVLRQLSVYADPYEDKHFYTYHVDIGGQTPMLGLDPEVKGEPILREVRWLRLDELCERDRAYLWASGLIGIPAFAEELSGWGDEISYPIERRGIRYVD